jgi:hypothetical protein
MTYSGLLTENQLDDWVRGHAEIAQGVIVELVWRLVAASSPNPKERRFPLGDSVGQPGPDGVLDVADFPCEPFVPVGRSLWEIGTGLDARKKATKDYKDRVADTPEEVRSESAFIFVTPLSGRRDWDYTWKEDAQADWIAKQLNRKEWRDVRVIDGTDLIDWLHHFPAVERWLAHKFGWPVEQLETPELRWNALSAIGEPLPLTPELFLVNRDNACEKLKDIFAGSTLQLKLDTYFPDQVSDFVSAYVAATDEESRIDIVGRCLLISGKEAYNAIIEQRQSHVLIIDFDSEPDGTNEPRLLQKARRARHAVIYRGAPGGLPHPNCATIPNPKEYHVQQALKNGGYSDERARILAQKSGGNLGSLLRLLQNVSLIPEWAEVTSAAELVIAEFLGSWNEKSEADRRIVEGILGKSYGEWIGKMREVALRPGTPLTHRDGKWKFVLRYEGWYALGPRIFDDHLDRLREGTVTVLRENDPKFELPPGERYASRIHGKVLKHSDFVRKGLAETLALLGGHPKALTSCSFGKAEETAVLAVREILRDADWVQWAGLDNLMPLLAEAAPEEFLNAVDKALTSDPCPLDELFAQERSGVTGATYTSGLLWALETLAWDTDYFSRVIVLLGELAARDPGGNWTNRPANSLTTILLPWMPQTCASIAKRRAAIAALLEECPNVAWALLLSLLPGSHSTSRGSRRPAWREMVPEDWSNGVSYEEYWEHVALYTDLAISAAKADLAKLAELIDRMEDLPPSAYRRLVEHLESDSVLELREADRLGLWTKLMDLVAKHSRFAGGKRAMSPDQVDKIAAIAERLKPDAANFRHQRLFSESGFGLYEEKDDFEQQLDELEERRRKAVEEIFSTDGVQAVLEFAKAVESPWRVGIAFGVVATSEADEAVLPGLLEAETKQLTQFAGGFVLGRFRTRGWQWVDEIDTSRWTLTQIGQFLAYLPFTSDTWERSARLLGQNDSPYWTKTNVNPYEADEGLELAVDALINHGSPRAAIGCLHKMRYAKQPLNPDQVVRALLAALRSPQRAQSVDAYKIVELIRALQNDPGANLNHVYLVEWAYLPILDRYHKAAPKLLERRLANEPGYFCKLIRSVFRSRKEEQRTEAATEEAKIFATRIYDLFSVWKTPPGCSEDGSFDGEALAAWLDAVTKECAETGHLEDAMTIVGQVLIHAPGDPDGLWIHRSAAVALNGKNAEKMRTGFNTALFNSRGTHGFTAGKEERALAAKYREQADAGETAGFQRLATTLRELAKSYERDAEHEASSDPFDDFDA